MSGRFTPAPNNRGSQLRVQPSYWSGLFYKPIGRKLLNRERERLDCFPRGLLDSRMGPVGVWVMVILHVNPLFEIEAATTGLLNAGEWHSKDRPHHGPLSTHAQRSGAQRPIFLCEGWL